MAKSKQVAGATNKSKVISSSNPNFVKAGGKAMFGKQSVKATKKS